MAVFVHFSINFQFPLAKKNIDQNQKKITSKVSDIYLEDALKENFGHFNEYSIILVIFPKI